MTSALALGGAVAVTWLLRVLTVTLVPASRLPRAVRDVLPQVGPAVLAALVTVAILSAPAHQRGAVGVAAAATAIAARRGRSPLAAVLVGLAVVTLVDLLQRAAGGPFHL